MKNEERKDIKVKGSVAKLTPAAYFLARASGAIYSSAVSEKNDIPLPTLYHLFCESVELGLKAAILSKEVTDKREKELKKLNHSLVDIYGMFEETFSNENLFTSVDIAVLVRLDKHYKTEKGFLYITRPVRKKLFAGWQNKIATKEEIGELSKNVNDFLLEKKLFIDTFSKN